MSLLDHRIIPALAACKFCNPPEPGSNQYRVCLLCGRKGTRGFDQSSGNGDGTRDTWTCTNTAACNRRQESAPLPERKLT